MKVVFKISTITAGIQAFAGSVHELPDDEAKSLIAAGICEAAPAQSGKGAEKSENDAETGGMDAQIGVTEKAASPKKTEKRG